MRSIVIGLILLIVNCCLAENIKVREGYTLYPIYTVVNSIITNEVEAAVYNKQTNGYTNVEYKMFENGNYLSTTSLSNWSGMYVNPASIPDPFAEKVTTKYFVVISKDIYYLHVADLEKREYAVKSTVIKRWKVVTTQKIKMNESTEKVVE